MTTKISFKHLLVIYEFHVIQSFLTFYCFLMDDKIDKLLVIKIVKNNILTTSK